MAITRQGTPVKFTGASGTFNIGSAGNDRLVVGITGQEFGDGPGQITVDGKNVTVHVETAAGGDGFALTLWSIHEDQLGGSNGNVTVALADGASRHGTHVALYHGAKSNTPKASTPNSFTSSGSGTTINLTGLTKSDGELGVGGGLASVSSTTASWSTLTEATDGNEPEFGHLTIADHISGALSSATATITYNDTTFVRHAAWAVWEAAAGGGAQTVNVGLASETDSAQTVTPVPGAAAVALGVAQETDTTPAVAAGSGTTVPVGLASETDTVPAATPVPGAATVPLGVAQEADTALPVASGGVQTVPVGFANETDSAPAVTAAGGAAALALGIAQEADTAFLIATPDGLGPRGLPPGVFDALGQAATAPRWLVELVFDSAPVRLWNGLGEIQALGETWTGAGRLGAIAPISETQDIVASGVDLQLLIVPTEEIPDAPDAILDIALAEDFQGRPATIYQAQLDPDTLALIDDPFVRFRGYMDEFEDTEIPGAALLRVTAENRLIDLERARKRTYTPEDQKSVYPGDTFFDEVAALQNREIILE